MVQENNDNNNHQDNCEHHQANHWHSSKHKLILGLLIVLILMFISFSCGFGAGRFSSNFMRVRRHGCIASNISGESTLQTNSYNSNLNVNSASLQGVITAKNGNTITVVGNGTTNNVTINSSTQYVGGTTIAVNDTVIITGQYNNNTFTAQTIEINP